MADKPIFELGVGKNKVGVVENGAKKLYGPYMCIGPVDGPGIEETQNRYSKLNFTGQPGTASALYFSLVFNLPKMGWNVVKADESIEVSPTHKEYYDRTNSTKQALESTIKTGLASASQAVADFELMEHDIRKYKEILSYFEKRDNRLLRSMFVDQVDIHTDIPGQPIALRTIVSRWPTIISDFMDLKDEEKEPKDIADKHDISKAEAVILSTKNKLFLQWKDMFRKTAKERYMRLRGLVISREKTIKEYKEWLKPYIARFRMTKTGLESDRGRSGTLRSFADITGMFTFFNTIKLFVWKPMRFTEHNKPVMDILSKKNTRFGHPDSLVEKFTVDPYDDYVRNEIILNKKNGLASDGMYPWLANPLKYCFKCKKFYGAKTEKCEECKTDRFLKDACLADKIVRENILPDWNLNNNLDPKEMYYIFVDINVERAGSRLQIGELEDIIFTNKVFVLSQNVMLVKMLELYCRDKELENYIDEMLGFKFKDGDIESIVREEFPIVYGEEKEDEEKDDKKDDKKNTKKKKDKGKKDSEVDKAWKEFRGNFVFLKNMGPYETDMKDRITKHYLKFAAIQLAGITNFLKAKMGVE